MSDPRFARLRTDPRFRRPKKHRSKVVLDERFKEIFEDGRKKTQKGQVDKYGRTISDFGEKYNLRQFYRLENANDVVSEPPAVPDYARGEAVLESSEEEEKSDNGDIRYDQSIPISVCRDDSEVGIDLDEGDFADLDSQAAAYVSELPQEDEAEADIERTRRIAVVNLDWDYVRAVHLYRICSSLVSPTAPAITSLSKSFLHPDRQRSIKRASSTVARGKVLSVRIYPSEFGKERMIREEIEGPPIEMFKKRVVEGEDEISEKNIYETGDGDNYDEDALRNYQLERLRYYYAIVTCDTVDAASHIYSELEGVELERSANVFDLRFVPDGMIFDDNCRDEALDDRNANHKTIDFVTDALRHSRVKLTWDEDDPERNQITRRTLTKQEIEEADFKAYLASSTSESEPGDLECRKSNSKEQGKAGKGASRDKLRALLLGGDDADLPEGWGRGDEDEPRDLDMEIIFTPGLSDAKGKDKEETTLEKYERKMKEKRKKRKELLKEKDKREGVRIDDDFFGPPGPGQSEESGEEYDMVGHPQQVTRQVLKNQKISPKPRRHESTADELALLAAPDNLNTEPKHFSMKAVLKAEKRNKGRRKKKKGDVDDNETQEDFVIDVNDNRFKAVHEDHTFAIDPSNPHFRKTKGMAALLDERSKRQTSKNGNGGDDDIAEKTRGGSRSLTSLVENVKRKSAMAERGSKKRRRM